MPQSYREGASSVNPDGGYALSVSEPATGHPLVYSRISQRTPEGHLCGYSIYRSAVKVLKFASTLIARKGGGCRGKVDGFSEASKRKLKFVSANSNQELVSQFCCTYHERAPSDGVVLKKHLNHFLTRLRQRYPGVAYIWIMEFQTKRLHPHFHIFLSLPVDQELHKFLAETWNMITQETEKHLKVHRHRRNFIRWSMGNGAYLANKYLHKENQKYVPDHFNNCGRFWGTSRKLVAPIEVLSVSDIEKQFDSQLDPSTGEIVRPSDHLKFIYRTLRKHHEAKVRFHQKYFQIKPIHNCIASNKPSEIDIKYSFWKMREQPKVKRFKSQIIRPFSAMLPFGGYIFPQIMGYLKAQYPLIPF